VGDAVFGTTGRGSFAELAVISVDALARKPDALSFEEAAAVPISATTALQALRDHGRLQAGQKVLVIGASGGVGTFAVQLAKAFGAEVTAVCSTSKVELVRELGAVRVIDYTREGLEDGERRYDVVLDIGGTRPVSELRRQLTPKGTLVLVGGEGGGRWLGGMERTLGAAALSAFIGQRLVFFIARSNAADLETLSEFAQRGDFRPVIDRTFPLAETAGAIDHVSGGHARGKVVITA
jgi:NADPH:quinone reductase-like Zn-dependent oxidoreductase